MVTGGTPPTSDDVDGTGEPPTVLQQWRTTLAATPVGVDLMTLLADRPPKTAAVDANDWSQAVLDSLTHRQRLLSHVTACQHADYAEFTAGYPGNDDWVLAELAMALNISETAAGNRAYMANRLVNNHPRTHAALLDGQFSDWHAHTIVDALDGTTPDVQEKVETSCHSHQHHQNRKWSNPTTPNPRSERAGHRSTHAQTSAGSRYHSARIGAWPRTSD